MHNNTKHAKPLLYAKMQVLPDYYVTVVLMSNDQGAKLIL